MPEKGSEKAMAASLLALADASSTSEDGARKKRRLGDGIKEDEEDKGKTRKDKSLGLLCSNFMRLFGGDKNARALGDMHDKTPCKTVLGTGRRISLDEAARELSVERRRIYDIVNILEALQMVTRERKNTYAWHGLEHLPSVLGTLQQEACELWPDLATQNRLTDATRLTHYLEVHERNKATTAEDAPIGGRDKSLGRLSRRFIQLFLVGLPTVSMADMATTLLHEKEQIALRNGCPQTDKALKTRARRLYDIANVFSAVGLVEKHSWVHENGQNGSPNGPTDSAGNAAKAPVHPGGGRRRARKEPTFRWTCALRPRDIVLWQPLTINLVAQGCKIARHDGPNNDLPLVEVLGSDKMRDNTQSGKAEVPPSPELLLCDQVSKLREYMQRFQQTYSVAREDENPRDALERAITQTQTKVKLQPGKLLTPMNEWCAKQLNSQQDDAHGVADSRLSLLQRLDSKSDENLKGIEYASAEDSALLDSTSGADAQGDARKCGSPIQNNGQRLTSASSWSSSSTVALHRSSSGDSATEPNLLIKAKSQEWKSTPVTELNKVSNNLDASKKSGLHGGYMSVDFGPNPSDQLLLDAQSAVVGTMVLKPAPKGSRKAPAKLLEPPAPGQNPNIIERALSYQRSCGGLWQNAL